FSPTSLVFSNQVVGTKSGGKNVKLTANGPSPLVISSITVTGDFLESSNCPASLNKGQSCNITINFKPTVGGPAAGSVFVTDNGLASPQTVPLSGNGLDFTLTASPSSVSVNAGQAALYTVTATEVGGSFNNNVNLTCSGLPAGAKCHFSPSGIAPKTGSASSSLSLSTTAGGSGTPPGTYSITVIGTSGSLQHAVPITLVVN
ncbi:MAG: choice-of-anchor D domain-containing protein, partial [Deltaproteobacteria bacterium]